MKNKGLMIIVSLALVAGLFGVTPAPRALAACANNSATQFRSSTTGNWNTNATWECSDDGTTWQAATTTPTSTNGVITIQTGHTVTVVADVSVDQVTIAGNLTISAASIAFTIADGTGTDLIVATGGTLTNSATANGITATGTWQVQSNGTYVHNSITGIATPFGKLTLDAASNFTYRGSSTLTPAVSMSGRTYGNLSFESTSGSWSTLALTGVTATVIQGNFTLGTGVTFNNNTLAGLTIAGNWTNNGTFTAGTGTVTFNKSGIATYGGSSTTTFNNLVVNAGTTLDVGTNTLFNANGTVTNNGTLKQIKTVNANSTGDYPQVI